MPTRLPYCLLDVFTDRRHAGNPLAVVFLADGLADAVQHAIAREFNLSETVFVQRPTSPDAIASLRIWTPGGELPFAGHPTVGMVWALAQRGAGAGFLLQEVIGTVTCRMEEGAAWFQLPKLPEMLPADTAPNWSSVLGVPAEAIVSVRLVSAGVPFWLVEVGSIQQLGALRPNAAAFTAELPAASQQVYAYVRDGWRTRMFAPALGVFEDPATGSAAAALSLVIAEALGEGRHDLTLTQGVEMGRPSALNLQLTIRGGALVDAWLGGDVVPVAEGWLNLD